MDDVELLIEDFGEPGSAENADMVQFLQFLHPDGRVFELSGILRKPGKSSLWNNEWTGKSGAIVAGWFENQSQAAETASRLDGEQEPGAIYVTLNPCRRDLLARCNHRLKMSPNRTKDADIERLCNLFIDIDPVRLSGMPSTNQEHELALQKAEHIRNGLRAEGWPEPAIIDSGNGAYLIYKTDLEPSEENRILIARYLKCLSSRYSDDKVEIDQQVGNPARLVRLAGTVNRKGDGSTERPHRLSRVVSIPDQAEPVSEELLRAVTYVQGTAEATEACKDTEAAPPVGIEKVDCNVDVEAYLRHYGRTVKKAKEYPTGMVYVLDHCLFADHDDKDKEASIIVNSEGKLIYQCFHNSCKEYTWADARKIISGKDRLTPFLRTIPGNTYMPAPKKTIEVVSAARLFSKEFIPPHFAVDGIIPDGLSLLCSKPKMGKSWMALHLAAGIAKGKSVLGNINAEHGPVLYLALEDTDKRIQQRLRSLLQGEPFPADLYLSYSSPRIDDGAQEELMRRIQEIEPKLVIIDTLAKVLPAKQRRDIYQGDYRAVGALKQIADSCGVPFIVIHHLRKSGAEDALDEVSGTVGYTGAADTILVLKRSRGSTDAELLVTGRDVEEKAYAMSFDNQTGAWSLLGDAERYRHSKECTGIIELISKAGGIMESKALHAALQAKGKKDSTIRWRLSDMVQRHLIERLGPGVYGLTESYKQANKTNITNKQTVQTYPTDPTGQQPAEDVGSVGNAACASQQGNHIESQGDQTFVGNVCVVGKVCNACPVNDPGNEPDVADDWPDESDDTNEDSMPLLPAEEPMIRPCPQCIHHISRRVDADEDIFYIAGCEMGFLDYGAAEHPYPHFDAA